MKAKFIKHINPRDSLGAGILAKRHFGSFEEFIDWLYKYVVPDFYNMSPGPELDELVRMIMKKDGANIPKKLYSYIKGKILPEITIDNTSEEQIFHYRFPYYLRQKYFEYNQHNKK